MTWDELQRQCRECVKCPLYETRTNCVFGAGNTQAELMFVGEAPGKNEDATGIPFVGAAGQLLNRYLTEAGIDRDSVYIANILKCRPPNNRDPLPSEEDECIEYLRWQVRYIKPKIIVCLGRIAAMRLIHEDYKITKEHGTIVNRAGFLITAVYHPAAILRDPHKGDDLLGDLKNIAALLISNKADEQ